MNGAHLDGQRGRSESDCATPAHPLRRPSRGLRVEILCSLTGAEPPTEPAAPAAPANPLRELALLWERQGCPDGLLLQGEALERAAAFAAAHAADVLDQERDLLERSQEAAQRTRGLQRQSALLRALMTLLVLAGVATMHLVLQARERATTDRLARLALQEELEASESSRADAAARATAEAARRIAAELGREAARQRLLAELEEGRARRSQALVAAVSDHVDEDRDLALLLAVEAARLWSGDDAPTGVRAALYRALGHANWEAAAAPTIETTAPDLAWLASNGRLLAADAEGGACLWDAASGERLYPLELAGHEVQRVAWSPDGRRFAALLSTGETSIWDADLGVPCAALPTAPSPVLDLAWDLDSCRLLTLHLDGHVAIWQAMTGQGLLALRDLPGIVAGQWAADGSALLLYQEDGTITRCDARTGSVLSTISAPLEETARFVASRGGGELAYSLDGGEHIYLEQAADLAELACARATRNLTPAEWARYLGADEPYRATCP